MRRTGRVAGMTAVLLTLLLVAAGCGSRVPESADTGVLGAVVEPDDGSETGLPVEEPSTEDDEPVADEAVTPRGAVEETDSSQANDQPQPQQEIPEEERIDLEVETSPRCVRVGDPISVTARTEPHAGLMMVVSHSDGRPHGQMGFAEANAEGAYVWRWVVGPQVPQGTATVLVGAWSQDGQRGGRERDEFRVAGLEGCQ